MVDTSQFDYGAEQLFVVAPRNVGSGILSLLLSLDRGSAALDFKQKSLDEKIHDWDRFRSRSTGDSHLYGFMNFGQPDHADAMAVADRCARYVHKCHFYELDAVTDNRRHSVLNKITGRKQAVGIWMSQYCVEKLQQIRPKTPTADWYQLWIYSNQKSLLKDFFGIDCQHLLPFSDMLDLDMFMDHAKYCADLFALDINVDDHVSMIQQWYEIVQVNNIQHDSRFI